MHPNNTQASISQDSRAGKSSDLQREREAALSRVDGDLDLLRDIVATFERESVVMLDAMRSSIRQMNAKQLRNTAHSMKGAVGIFEAKSAYAAAGELEMVATVGDWSRAADVLQKLESELRLLDPFFTDIRQGKLL